MDLRGVIKAMNDLVEIKGIWIGNKFVWPDPWTDIWTDESTQTWETQWHDAWSNSYTQPF
jgi:hypothetical protein